MKKDELIAAIADASGESKSSVAAVLGALAGVSEGALKGGKTVAIPGLGKFDSAERAERQVRNPRTGETSMAPAHTAPRFKFATPFKAAIKG